MNSRITPERQWLIRNHGSIEWKLNTPDIKNPFDSSVSEAKLEDYISDRSLVMEACKVVAIMDETEILRIEDLTSLKYKTEHPNIMNIDAENLDGYMRENGIWDLISEKFDEFKRECEDELARRRNS